VPPDTIYMNKVEPVMRRRNGTPTGDTDQTS
jgi:hypothetical protein